MQKLPLSIFRPYLVEEGARVRRFYSVARWVPFELAEAYEETTYTWKKIAYPIPVSLVLSAWYRLVYLVQKDARVPPQMYVNKVFHVLNSCPHCKESLRNEIQEQFDKDVLVRR
jgi:ABC-type microcin C transport system permease subunit YejB